MLSQLPPLRYFRSEQPQSQFVQIEREEKEYAHYVLKTVAVRGNAADFGLRSRYSAQKVPYQRFQSWEHRVEPQRQSMSRQARPEDVSDDSGEAEEEELRKALERSKSEL